MNYFSTVQFLHFDNRAGIKTIATRCLVALIPRRRDTLIRNLDTITVIPSMSQNCLKF